MKTGRIQDGALRAAALGAALCAAAAGAGCPERIGGKCDNSLDCSSERTRLCDISQPGGYCLIPGCEAGGSVCPHEASCVAFRDTAESFCLRACERDAQCRDGYVCCVPEADAGIAILPLPDGGVPANGDPGYCIAADPDTGARPTGCAP
ncbi:MAG TPA: hypothetical protein VG389_02145 [Myxococcota bacterium]|jgi:hypothetical protein|nr:hypothetical protein [Myxococcota bacterium]